ncbi:hypothetical protein Tco_0669367 [Tanacetum coccineum]
MIYQDLRQSRKMGLWLSEGFCLNNLHIQMRTMQVVKMSVIESGDCILGGKDRELEFKEQDCTAISMQKMNLFHCVMLCLSDLDAYSMIDY